MSLNNFAYYLIKLAKRARGFLRYQWIRIYFFLIPRFRSKVEIKDYGVNFIGYAQGELGLGQAMRSMVYAALTASIPLVVRKFKASIPSKQSNDKLNQYSSVQCQYPVNILSVNPDTLHLLPSWVSYSEWAKTYNIGYWFWELENFPTTWNYATNIVDEIWVATDYVANAMRKSGKKVVKIPFPLEFELPPESMSKNYFGINPGQFTFLCSFDFLSYIERKNPAATIAAFQKAFSAGDHSAHLILKTVNGHLFPQLRAELEKLIEGDVRIEIRDGYLSQEEMRGFIRSADCYISLHRAEGLGLGLAEAMYLGKPTIATGYSGNLEFMNHSNSMLIPFSLISVPPQAYPNGEGQFWADPDIYVAARAMQKLANNANFGKNLGEKAAIYIQEQHSYSLIGQIMRVEVARIYRQLKSINPD